LALKRRIPSFTPKPLAGLEKLGDHPEMVLL